MTKTTTVLSFSLAALVLGGVYACGKNGNAP